MSVETRIAIQKKQFWDSFATNFLTSVSVQSRALTLTEIGE
jgi:hypothetical protein